MSEFRRVSTLRPVSRSSVIVFGVCLWRGGGRGGLKEISLEDPAVAPLSRRSQKWSQVKWLLPHRAAVIIALGYASFNDHSVILMICWAFKLKTV